MNNTLRIALTKGRLEKKTAELLTSLGYDCTSLADKGRRLILPINNADGSLAFEAVLAKSPDVITYIEHGVCDIGVVGKDTITEMNGRFFEVADLGFGKCRFALAGKVGVDFFEGYGMKRIASKYPNVAAEFFRGKNMDVEIIKIEGSVELAPLLGLSDGIVDIVETGATLKENGLEVKEYISNVSARLIVNIASMKLRQMEIQNLLSKLNKN